MMVLSEVLVTSLPVVISVAMVAGLVFILMQCACRDRQSDKDPQLTQVTSKHDSAVLSPDTVIQVDTNGTSTAVHLDVETAVAPVAMATGQNGTLHSRGNSEDLTKTERHSGTSTGSSPRPNTLSRELPDIPVPLKSHPHSQLPEIPHSQLPDIPTTSKSSTSTLDSLHRGGHPHSQLPEIPPNQSPAVESSLRGGNSNAISSSKLSPAGARAKLPSPETTGGASAGTEGHEFDDYDHIDDAKKKRARPRSDYDHVVIDGGEKRIIPAKTRRHDDDDYAEVRNENIYEGVPELAPVSKPQITSITVGRSPQKDAVKKINSIDDPYNRVKDDDPPYNKIKEPPYNKIKDDPYNKIKFDDPYNKLKDDDPYNKVKETDIDDLDPYDDLKDGDSPGGRASIKQKQKNPTARPDVYDPYSLLTDDERNVSNQTDPYASVREVEIDDPYNKVTLDDSDTASASNSAAVPDYTDDDYATVNKVGNAAEYAKVNKPSAANTNTGNHGNGAVAMGAMGTGASGIAGNTDSSTSAHLNSLTRMERHDEYATVVKVRNVDAATVDQSNAGTSSVNQSNNVLQTGAAFTLAGDRSGPQTPPEPPRGYQQDTSTDTDHYNRISANRLVPSSQQADTGAQQQTSDTQGVKKEPPYNKLSVRESLASMNARVANNTYEYVSEVDNLYATVDGSSGDGVVQPKSPTAGPRTSFRSEDYAEIEGATAAPAPPSLQSLHETSKHHHGEIRRNVDYYNIDDTSQGSPASGQGHVIQGHQRTLSDQCHIRTPSGEVMTSSFEGRVTLAMEENVELDIDPNYQMMRDPKVAADANSDFDPNYETVEEAKSKVKYEEINGARAKQTAIRDHIYEEADPKPSNSQTGSEQLTANNMKIRAHVYEEVTMTNEARQTRQRVLNMHTYEEVSDVKGEAGESVGSVQRRKKGHERSSSGDQMKVGKRKSGDGKDKGKDGRRKSEGKDHRKSGDMKDHRKSGDMKDHRKSGDMKDHRKSGDMKGRLEFTGP